MANPTTEPIPLPLLKSLENYVLPWQRQWGMDRCLIAPYDLEHPRALQKWLTTGGSVESHTITGPKVSVKGPRNYRNRSMLMARWPEAHMESRRTTMLACVLSGQPAIPLGNRLVHFSPGHSFIILPGLPFPQGQHPLHTGEGHCEILWITGGTDFGIGCWKVHSEGGQHYELSAERCYVSDPAAVSFFEALTNEAAQKRGPHREICHHLFVALLLTLCREIEVGRVFQFTHQKFNPLEMGNFNHFLDPIPAVQNYVKYNLHLPLHIDDVARQFFLSRTQFTQRFRKETGMSFHDYLTSERLTEAKRLLGSTAWSITMIERAVGFNSSRMRVLFNREFGLSPQQYRRQIHSQTPVENDPKSERNTNSEKVRTRRNKTG